MKLAAYGDLHAHLFQEFADPDPECGNTRLREIVRVVKAIHKYCDLNDISTILFAGDLFHVRKAVDTTVWNALYDTIKESSQLYVMIPGNHDQVDNSDIPDHSLHGFRELTNVVMLDGHGEEFFYMGNVGIFPVPYSKNAQMVKDKINYWAKKGEEFPCPILLGHLGVSGAYVGKSNYAMADAFSVADLRPDAFKFGVFGHFHKWQFLGNTDHFFYTGAPIQHNFNDEGQDKGFWVLDTDTGRVEFVAIPSPKFITVTDDMVDKIDPTEYEGNYVRFQVSEKKVEELSEKLEGQEVKYRVEPQKVYVEERRVDVDFSMSYAEIVTEFSKKFNAEALDVGLEILAEAEQK